MNILESLGLTPEHNLAVANMDKNFTGSQFDYAAASTRDMVDRASNPLTSVVSAVGNVAGRPVYDFIDAAKEYGKKGYQGEFSLTPRGAIDFYGNLKSFGKEFLAQKPDTMMAGALKGGIQSLGTTLGESIYDLLNPDDEYSVIGMPQRSKQQQLINLRRQQLMNRRKQDMQKRIRQAEAVQQVQQNIQTYGNRDRPNTGMNVPGGGKGQSPTGGDVTGTPFVRGGRVSYFDGGLASLWLR